MNHMQCVRRVAACILMQCFHYFSAKQAGRPVCLSYYNIYTSACSILELSVWVWPGIFNYRKLAGLDRAHARATRTCAHVKQSLVLVWSSSLDCRQARPSHGYQVSSQSSQIDGPYVQ